MAILTDKEILDLSTIEFVDSDGQDVLVLLDDVKVVGNIVQVNGSQFSLSKEHIDKIILKKAKLSLQKANIDAGAIAELINTSIETGVRNKIDAIATELEGALVNIQTGVNQLISTDSTYNNMLSVNDKMFTKMSDSFENINSNVNSVMKELKVLIED